MATKLEIPNHAIGEIRSMPFPDNVVRQDDIELQLRTTNEEVNVRDLIAFLRVSDRIYAEFYPNGPRSYSRRVGAQLRIESVRAGSLEVSFVQQIENIARSHPLIVIWLIWRMMKDGSEVLKNVSEALLNWKEALSSRAREMPQTQISPPTEQQRIADESVESGSRPPSAVDISENKLADVSNEALKQVGYFVNQALRNENIRQAARFAHEEVIDVRLRIRKK